MCADCNTAVVVGGSKLVQSVASLPGTLTHVGVPGSEEQRLAVDAQRCRLCANPVVGGESPFRSLWEVSLGVGLKASHLCVVVVETSVRERMLDSQAH